jgi:hypothetical protein
MCSGDTGLGVCRFVHLAAGTSRGQVNKVSIVGDCLILALLGVPTVPGAGTHTGSQY